MTNNETGEFFSIMANETSSDETIVQFLRRLNFVCFAMIGTTGLCGNAFSIFIIAKTHLHKISSNHYLIALAASDSVFLIALLMMWFSKVGMPTYHTPGVCSFVNYLLNCSSWLSSWYTTALTVERCFVVYKPLRKNKVCTISRTRRTILLLIPWPLLFNVWVFFGIGVSEKGRGCNVLEPFYQRAFILNNVDTFVTFILPVIFIVTCNSLISVKLCRPSEDRAFFMIRGVSTPANSSESKYTFEMRKHGGKAIKKPSPGDQSDKLKQKIKSRIADKDFSNAADKNQTMSLRASVTTNQKCSSPTISSSATNGSQPQSATSNQERNITVTLLVISFVFVAMNLPSYAMRIRLFVLVMLNKENNVTITLTVVETLFHLLYYLNFSCNFVVYCLSSKNFRQAVKKMWAGKTWSLTSLSSQFPFRYITTTLRSSRKSNQNSSTPSNAPHAT